MRKWLIELRTEKGLSQYKLSDILDIPQSTYAGIETGARNPSVTLAKKIASFFNVDWTRFFE